MFLIYLIGSYKCADVAKSIIESFNDMYPVLPMPQLTDSESWEKGEMELLSRCDAVWKLDDYLNNDHFLKEWNLAYKINLPVINNISSLHSLRKNKFKKEGKDESE